MANDEEEEIKSLETYLNRLHRITSGDRNEDSIEEETDRVESLETSTTIERKEKMITMQNQRSNDRLKSIEDELETLLRSTLAKDASTTKDTDALDAALLRLDLTTSGAKPDRLNRTANKVAKRLERLWTTSTDSSNDDIDTNRLFLKLHKKLAKRAHLGLWTLRDRAFAPSIVGKSLDDRISHSKFNRTLPPGVVFGGDRYERSKNTIIKEDDK